MNSIKNKVQLIGNLGNVPEIKEFKGGVKKARLNLATNENYRNSKGEKITETQWHNVIAWGKMAEIMEKHVTKGMEIMIEGKLVNRVYKDKDGNKRYTTEVQATELLLLSRK